MIKTIWDYKYGRLGNHFFRNITANFIAEKNNLYVEYSKDFKEFGLNLFSNNIRPKNDNLTKVIVGDNDFIKYMNKEEDCSRLLLDMNSSFFQTNIISHMIYNFLREENNKKNIVSSNQFKNRFNNNNDLFIHVRLGDAVSVNPGIDYYIKVLNSIKFEKGYISSDSIHSELCKKLIKDYNLTPILYDEIKTVQFASTCKHILLSNGTFSWMIGALSFYSNVYYPTIKHKWHGDIFNMKEWTEINY